MKTTIVKLEIPTYDPKSGLQLEWEKNFYIKITKEEEYVILRANENGLRSLAKHLLCLANKDVPANYHIHLDDSNSLENGSCELLLEKIE